MATGLWQTQGRTQSHRRCRSVYRRARRREGNSVRSSGVVYVQYGGELVEINDLATNEFIVTSLNGLWWQNNGVWIGLNDRQSEQHFRWATGQQPIINGVLRSKT